MIQRNRTYYEGRSFTMMNSMRGRNLKHPGCLIGTTTGLTVGIILAGVLAMQNVPLNVILLIWLALTLVPAIAGWFIGSAVSPRFAPLPEKNAEADSETTKA
jgi:hypothetical protein